MDRHPLPHQAFQAHTSLGTRLIPQMSASACSSTHEVIAINEKGESIPTAIAGERPLTLYLDRQEIVTLMTLGAAPEALALGYLRNQGLVKQIDDIGAVQVDWETESVAVTTRPSLHNDTPIPLALGRRTVTSGCGQGTMYGDLMEQVESIKLSTQYTLSQEILYRVMDQVRRHESIYKVSGAVHGCALCHNTPDTPEKAGEILLFVEDVGRHNAVDAIAGLMWLQGWAGDDKIFYTTGRLTSEMVIKCAQMRIPFLLSRSGLTEMGWRIAEQLGITLIGRCQGKHYLLFCGKERFISPTPSVQASSP